MRTALYLSALALLTAYGGGLRAAENGAAQTTTDPVTTSAISIPESAPVRTQQWLTAEPRPTKKKMPSLAMAQPITSLNAQAEENFTKDDWARVSLIPMIGGMGYSGDVGKSVDNSLNLSLALEIPVTLFFSLELQGDFAKCTLHSATYNQNFNIGGFGANLKVYLSRHRLFRTFVGVGAEALVYYNLLSSSAYPGADNYTWVGAGEPFVGADLTLFSGVALGFRGSYDLPAVNSLSVVDRNTEIATTSFYRAMGTLRFQF